jgi:hypothetical protein
MLARPAPVRHQTRAADASGAVASASTPSAPAKGTSSISGRRCTASAYATRRWIWDLVRTFDLEPAPPTGTEKRHG